MATTDYDWQSLKVTPYRVQGRTRQLIGWWVLLAVLLSVLVHIFLVILFGLIQIERLIPGFAPKDQLLAFKTSRVAISKSSLDEILPQPPSAERVEPVETESTSLIDKSLSEYELQELLADKEVRLTPQVTEATRILASEKPTVRQGEVSPVTGEIPSSSAETIRTDLAAMKSQLLEATRASESQPLLELNTEPENRSKAEDYLDTGSKSLTQGSRDTAVTQGFSNLDNLLSQRGPLPDNTKPILMPTDLLFDYDKAALREEAKLSLMRLGILIQRNPDSEFVIEGHTDTLGSPEYNQLLSKRRANAVRVWLLDSLRIVADNVRAIGFGETRPIVNPSGSIEEQALNRRVEIVINKKKVRAG